MIFDIMIDLKELAEHGSGVESGVSKAYGLDTKGAVQAFVLGAHSSMPIEYR